MTRNRDHRCGICETPVFERNNYFTGKLMYPRDFCAEQEYFNEKRWLLNRALFGWGVVCGLEVTQRRPGGPLMIGPGLALDGCGHEILLCEEMCIPLEELEPHCRHTPSRGPHRLVLCLEYRACRTEPVVDPNTPDCDGPERTRHNRIRDAHSVRIRRLEEMCLDRERDCYLDAIKEGPGPEEAGHCRTPGLHEHLCETSTECPECASCDCIVLAVVDVTFPREPGEEPGRDESPQGKPKGEDVEPEKGSGDPAPDGPEQTPGKPGGEPPPDDERAEPEPPRVEIDACTHRQLVHPNPRLHDLIACFHGDAPRIVELRWRRATRGEGVVDWNRFTGIVRGGLTVVFDRPIDPATLHRRSFLVAALVPEAGTGYTVRKYFPCKAIEYRENEDAGCYLATFHPEEAWVEDELEGRHSELAEGVDVEIVLRGSLIVDEDGRALDGEYIDGRLPTGNGVQGGDFVDWFRVGPREEAGRWEDEEEAEEEAEVERFENF